MRAILKCNSQAALMVLAVREAQIKVARHSLPITLVIPQAPPVQKTLILYATGDDGFRGTNNLMLSHMAERGYRIAAFDSNALLSRIRQSEAQVSMSSAAVAIDRLLM